jgi:hypothetical protein
LHFDGFARFWEVNGERGANAELSVEAELASVFAHDGEHGGEAEAGAVFLGGEKRVKDFFDVLGFDAGAVVADFELDIVAGGEGGVMLRVRVRKSAVFNFNTTVRATRSPSRAFGHTCSAIAGR